MNFNKSSLKTKVGSLILIIYPITLVLLGLLHIPNLSLGRQLGFSFGTIIAIAVKIGIITVYWYAVKMRYVKVENKVSIKYLILGVFLIMIAVPSLGINFIESFIVVSLGIILRNDYKICLK